jgi:hypothetical protein
VIRRGGIRAAASWRKLMRRVFYMEQTLEHAGQLLNGVTDIITRYEETWQKTGEKYNIFTVAGIAHKEVVMCRVLADLMNPRGKHGQGSRYLTLFWEITAPKLPGFPALDLEHTKVTTELVIDENRRIDIVIEDGNVFVPVEVKIRAGDQHNQTADYFKFAKTKNGDNHIPVLYLTLDGHEPSDYSKEGLSQDDYVSLSFKNNILTWLETCARENTPEPPVPVRENLKQLTAAVKSLCGRSEDAKMEDEIFKQITKDDDSIRAALAIRGAVDLLDRKVKEAFKDTITALVKESFPDAEYEHEGTDNWYSIDIPIRQGNYNLWINYDWKSLTVGDRSGDAKTEKALAEKMSGLTGDSGTAYGNCIWAVKGAAAYPGLSAADERLYLYHLYKLYTEKPQEAADRIVSIARALEAVEGGK